MGAAKGFLSASESRSRVLDEDAAKGLDLEALFFRGAASLGESSSANGLVESSSSSAFRRASLIAAQAVRETDDALGL